VLRAYGQRDPLNEYKSEAFALFNAMLDELKERVTAMLARADIAPEPQVETLDYGAMTESHPDPAAMPQAGSQPFETAVVDEITVGPLRSTAVDPNDPETWRNIGRNAPCPCGSGRKFKHCHGRNV
jgi:preprotein translocase subunit SecA